MGARGFVRPRALAWALLVAHALLLGPVAGRAVAQGGEVTVENLSFSAGAISYRMPVLRFRGTALTKAEIEAILSPSSAEPVAARIGRLAAREVSAPEVIVEVRGPQGLQTSVYRDLVATEVGGGRMRSVTAAGGTIGGPPGPKRVDGSFGRMAVEDIDLAHGVALFTEKAGPGPAPMKRLYGSFSLDGLSMTGEGGVVSRIGRMSGRDVAARLTPGGWRDVFGLAGVTPDLDKASPEERRRVFGAVADLLEAFEFGILEMTGSEFSAGAPAAGRTTIARIALTGSGGGRTNEMAVEGVEAVFPQGRFKLDRFAIGDVSLAGTFEALRNIPPPGQGLSPAEIRKITPLIGSVTMSGLDAQFKAEPEGGAGETMKLGVGKVEMTAGKPLQGIPTDLKLAFRNIAFTLPRASDNDAARELARLGYDKLDLSMEASFLYDATRQELAVRDLSLDGAEMGRVGLRATLGGLSPAIFEPDTAVASVALLGATAKGASVTVTNGGLADRLLTLNARRSNRTPEDLRREYGMTAAIGIPAMLGNSPAAKALGQAVAQFVAKPGRLVVEARAREPSGFGVADFAAAPDPASVMEKLEVSARAE